MGDLGNTFDACRLTTAAARIADVAKDNTYTIIGDPDHTVAAPYEVIANKETMHALSSAGVKHIATEAFLTADQKILDSYNSGELSDRTMDYVVKRMGAPSLAQDGLGLDDSFQKRANFDLVRNAKAEGIKVHGVNGSEGIVPPETSDEVNGFIGDMKYTMAMAIEQNPQFFEMTRRQQGEFMTKTLYDNGYNDEEVVSGLEVTGFRKQQFLDVNNEDAMREILVKRLEEDPYLTKRIQDVTGGEKTLVIYGQLHTQRPSGDVDAALPDSAVIGIYRNQAEYTQKMTPQLQEFTKLTGMDMSDNPDFQLDVETGRWTNDATGEVTTVTMPSLPSVPVPQNDPAPSAPMPPPQTYELPDFKFK